ncbi:hypothetical protein ACQPZK_08975 [Micromonospora sp. CA-249363]|uniref:hypothetical protein n=1 Tax=Micromonospora sp. CA-249363 TaxID=3239963 RepID=UPI003D927C12
MPTRWLPSWRDCGRCTGRSRRDEWIFDEQTYEYLGERSYLVADTSGGPAGTVLATTAVLQRALVSNLGQRPEG